MRKTDNNPTYVRILICDDDKSSIEELKQYLTEYDAAQVIEFRSIEPLKNFNERIDIAFIDMQLGENSGFEAAEIIKKTNDDCIIVFYTNYVQYMKQSFEYRAFRYILKEEPREFIKKQVDDTIAEFYSKNRNIAISSKDGITYIDSKDIVYIEMFDHLADVKTSDGRIIKWHSSLNRIIKQLPKNFLRCNKSCIINLDKITKISGSYVIIEDTVKLSIGRSYKNQLFKLIDKY